jgi:hypothetical protein
MSRKVITKSSTHRGYEIQSRAQGSIKAILDAIINSMEYMWDTCNKNLCVSHFLVQLKDVPAEESNKYIT